MREHQHSQMVCLGNDSGNGFIELSKDKIEETIMNEKKSKCLHC